MFIAPTDQHRRSVPVFAVHPPTLTAVRCGRQLMSELVREGRPLLEGAVRPKEDEVCLDSDGEDEKDVNEAQDNGEGPVEPHPQMAPALHCVSGPGGHRQPHQKCRPMAGG